MPTDARAAAHREWLLVQTRSPWTVAGTTYPSGALLAAKFDDFMAGKPHFTVLFEPDAHTSLAAYAWTQNHLILDVLDDVKSRLEVLTPPENQATADDWKRADMPGAPAMSTISVVDTDPDHSDEYWLNITGFLTPSSLARGVAGQRARRDAQAGAGVLRRGEVRGQPALRHLARTARACPYFEVAPKDMQAGRLQPRRCSTATAGSRSRLQPHYSGSVGRAWLERGGVYVVANIRGGGEYGPQWHQAALKENRPRAYEDFAAVAEDLVAAQASPRRSISASKAAATAAC